MSGTVIAGPAFVLGDNIDTDQIIPAEHLVLNPSVPSERKLFGRHALCGVPPARSGLPAGNIPFIELADPANTRSRFRIIIGGRNFGCGSSREHAPLALAEAGVTVVVAESYARIFFRNSVNGGYLRPYESPVRLTDEIRTGDEVVLDTAACTLTDKTTGKSYSVRDLGDVGPIVEAGGIFRYARQSGMLKAK